MLSVVTYNILLSNHLVQILDWFSQQEHHPDILCLQEFDQNKIPLLKEFFPEEQYYHEFCPASSLRGKTYGQMTVFRRSKLQLFKTSFISLGHYPGERILFKVLGERRALVTHFSKPKEFIIANTHLPLVTFNSKRRALLKYIIDSLSSTECPSIILGDMNYVSPLGKKKLLRLMSRHGFSNATHKVKTHRLGKIIKQQLDYVFYRGCQIQNVRVERVPFSDHYPVFFELDV